MISFSKLACSVVPGVSDSSLYRFSLANCEMGLSHRGSLGEKLQTYLVVFTVLIRKFDALLAEMFLHQRVDDNFLPDGVTCDLPRKLVSPAFLGILVPRCADILVVILVHLKNVQGYAAFQWGF